MTVNPADGVLLRLLAAAVNTRAPALDKALSDPEWSRVYGQAAKQGVLAVAWESVRRLPPDLLPDRGIEVAVGVRGGADRLAFEETSAGGSPFSALCTARAVGGPAQRDRIVPVIILPLCSANAGISTSFCPKGREGERDRPMPGNEGFGDGL